MKKVYQTIVSQDNGNCMQAAVASLFDLELDEVPNFIQLEIDDPCVSANMEEMLFIQEHGYEYCCYFPSGNYDDKPTEEQIEKTLKILHADNGINGYFYASVPSKTFQDGYHAVIIDKYMNVVHDPNPNQLALTWTKYDIKYIVTNSNNWSIDKDNNLKTNRMKFREKPVVIDAAQWNGKLEDVQSIFPIENAVKSSDINHENGTFVIHTLEGDMTASLGDWIIKGVNGECYPCKPDIFTKTYDEVNETTFKERLELEYS